MSATLQSLYDEYVSEHGPPQDPKHLIAFAKLHGQTIKFSEAKQLMSSNAVNGQQQAQQSDAAAAAVNGPSNTPRSRRGTMFAVASNSSLNASTKKIDPTLSPRLSHKKPDTNGLGFTPDLASLESFIQPLASIKPQNVSQKTLDDSMSMGEFGDAKDLDDEQKYKSVKSKAYVKKKNTGTTPKAIQTPGNATDGDGDGGGTSFGFGVKNNPWMQNDRNTKKKSKNKTRKTHPRNNPANPADNNNNTADAKSPGHARKATPTLATKKSKKNKRTNQNSAAKSPSASSSSPLSPTLKSLQRKSAKLPNLQQRLNAFKASNSASTASSRSRSPGGASSSTRAARAITSVSAIAAKFEPIAVPKNGNGSRVRRLTPRPKRKTNKKKVVGAGDDDTAATTSKIAGHKNIKFTIKDDDDSAADNLRKQKTAPPPNTSWRTAVPRKRLSSKFKTINEKESTQPQPQKRNSASNIPPIEAAMPMKPTSMHGMHAISESQPLSSIKQALIESSEESSETTNSGSVSRSVSNSTAGSSPSRSPHSQGSQGSADDDEADSLTYPIDSKSDDEKDDGESHQLQSKTHVRSKTPPAESKQRKQHVKRGKQIIPQQEPTTTPSGLAQATPLSDAERAKLELDTNAKVVVAGAKTKQSAKKKSATPKQSLQSKHIAINKLSKLPKKKATSKWDKTLEKEVVEWINSVMQQPQLVHAKGRAHMARLLENGQLLCRVMNKVVPARDAIAKKTVTQKPNPKADSQRVQQCIQCMKLYGVSDAELFEADDVLQGKDVVRVLRALQKLKQIAAEKATQTTANETPLSMWCKLNALPDEILSALRDKEFSLLQLHQSKSDDLDSLCDEELQLSSDKDRLAFMRCMVTLKESPCVDEWIVLQAQAQSQSREPAAADQDDHKDDKDKESSSSLIYCNMETNDIYDVQYKEDAQKVLPHILALTLHDEHSVFLTGLVKKYWNADWFVQTLLRCLSRIESEKYEVWSKNIGKKIETIFEFKRYAPKTDALLSHTSDAHEITANKISFNIMELLCNEQNLVEVHQLIEKYHDTVALHALSVFHPSSKGNAYHARIILDALLERYANLFLPAIASNTSMQLLLRYAVFTRLVHGNFNAFILELISFQPRMVDQGGPFATIQECAAALSFKMTIIQHFVAWNAVSYILSLCSGDHQFQIDGDHDDAIVVGYSTFMTELVSRCAYDEEAAELLKVSGAPPTQLVDAYLFGLLNAKLSLSNRTLCAHAIVSILNVLKTPTLVLGGDDENGGADGGADETMSMPNHLYELFEPCMLQLYARIPELCDVIRNDGGQFVSLQPIKINCTTIREPLGQIRLSCLEILGVMIDLAMMNAAQPFSYIPMLFWDALLSLMFAHCNNNFFLNHIRKILHLCMLFRRRILKYLCEQQNMLRRCLQFYSETPTKTELHGFLIEMLWLFYSNDQLHLPPEMRDPQAQTNFSDEAEDEFDIYAHFEANEEWSHFMQHIEAEMTARITQPSAVGEEEDFQIDSPTGFDLNQMHAGNQSVSSTNASESGDEDYGDDFGFDDDDDFDDAYAMAVGDDDDGDDDADDDEKEDAPELDWNPFRGDIERNAMPTVEYVSHFGVFKHYDWDALFQQHERYILFGNEAQDLADMPLLYISYCLTRYLQSTYLIFKYNINKEKVFPRPKLNLMIVLDHSARMSHKFRGEERSKMEVTNEILCAVVSKQLRDGDRVGLISYNHETYQEFDLCLKSEHDLDQFTNCVSKITAEGGCDLDGAYQRAVDAFADYVNGDGDEDNADEYDHRILVITTRQLKARDSAADSLLNMCYQNSNNSNIYTTFLAVSRAFAPNIVSEINECRGCNYFHITSSADYAAMHFEFAVTPLFFNVRLFLVDDAQSAQSVVRNVYGGMMNDHERQHRCQSGNVSSLSTIFPRTFDHKENVDINDIKVVQLNDDVQQFLVHLGFEDRTGSAFQCTDSLVIPTAAAATATTDADPWVMTKAMLLTNYVNALKQWLRDDTDESDNYLKVTASHKQKFGELLKEFESAMSEHPEDDSLQIDANVLDKLSKYDMEAAQMIRNLTQSNASHT